MIPRISGWWATDNSGRGKVSDLATSKIVNLQYGNSISLVYHNNKTLNGTNKMTEYLKTIS